MVLPRVEGPGRAGERPRDTVGVGVDVGRAQVDGTGAADRQRRPRVPVQRLAGTTDDGALDARVAACPPLDGVDRERRRQGLADGFVGAKGLDRPADERLAWRGEIRVSGFDGSSAETNRTSLVALSPVETTIRLRSCDLPTSTVKPQPE